MSAADSTQSGSRRSDIELAHEIAAEAAALLLALRSSPIAQDPAQLRDEGDRRSHELIVRRLRAERPDDPVLSEEGADDTQRLHSQRVWIVDPLDGTREFGELDRDDWAVHVALVEEHVPTVAAVALAAQGLILATTPAATVPAREPGPIRLAVSRSHTPPEAETIAAALGAELIHMGSAGAKTMAVVSGAVDAYVHLGGQYEWDSAAPVGVAAAAGLWTSRADGSPLRYNNANPWLPDQVVCRPEFRDRILDAVATVR